MFLALCQTLLGRVSESNKQKDSEIMLLKVAGQTNVEISNTSYTVCATNTFTSVWSEYDTAGTHVTKTKVPFEKEREIPSLVCLF